ncbi:extracellular solute-binding protein [Peptoclostridium litorale]|nr:extracellular solute-binding protein [Peptoclostridium litorale]
MITILLVSFKLENTSTINNGDALGKEYGGISASFKELDIPEGYDIRQFEGMTLSFIVENNISANIFSHESEEFSKVTGINVKTRAMDYETMVKKMNLDFISQSGKYQIIYVDPYQTLNRFHSYLEVLNQYNENPDYPHVMGLGDDFFENQKYVCSYFGKKDSIYSIPFDSTTMIMYYRKDIFEKYRDSFFKEMGYDWTPGTPDFTWKRYCEVAKWIDENVPDNEVKYGSGHMAQEHNSIFCDFSNVLASYGGDYFSDEDISTLGLESFEHVDVLDGKFTRALDMYKDIVKTSAPESVNWNWTDTANAFRNGEIAMMTNWDENYSYIDHDLQSSVRGKVGYSILPYGDERSANIYGGSGIGINRYASEREKKAAWLYIVWATSKDMQLKVLMHPEGGSLPTRKSAYSEVAQKYKMDDNELLSIEDTYLKHVKAVMNAWESQNIYLRPKISSFYEVERVLVKNLHEMVEYDRDSSVVSRDIYKQLEEIRRKEAELVEEDN